MASEQQKPLPNLITDESQDAVEESMEPTIDISSAEQQQLSPGQQDMELSEEERLLEEAVGNVSKESTVKERKSGTMLRKLAKEQKLAEGTWLSPAEWRRANGLTKKRQKKRNNPGPGGSGKQTDQQPSASQGQAQSSINKSKRNLSDSSESPSRTPVAKKSCPPAGRPSSVVIKTNTTDNRPAEPSDVAGTSGLTAAQVAASVKIALVPADFPEGRFTEAEVFELRCTIGDEICEAEDPSELRICKSYFERGAAVLICENEDTRAWVKQISPKLKVGGPTGGGWS